MSRPVSLTAKVAAILEGHLAEPDVFDNLEHEQRSALWEQRDCGNVIVRKNLRKYAVACERQLAERPPVYFDLHIGPPAVHHVLRLDAPDIADELDGSNAHTDLCECPMCNPASPLRKEFEEINRQLAEAHAKIGLGVCSECRASAPNIEDGVCLACALREQREHIDSRVKAESRSNFPPSASMTRSADGDYAEFHFRLCDQRGVVRFHGKLLRVLGDKGMSALEAMANEVREMLRGFEEELGPEMVFEELARWVFATDPEVIAFIDRASEAPLAKVRKEPKWNREGLMRKRAEHLATAWERGEPKGARKRALLRAKAVWKEMQAGR